MKDFGGEGELSDDDRINRFFSVATFVLSIHAFLTELAVAAWIYHLALAFRLQRYLDWLIDCKLGGIIDSSCVFLWRRGGPDSDWMLPVDKGILKYFQAAFQYSISAITLVALGIVVIWRANRTPLDVVFVLGAVAFVIAATFLGLLLRIHLRVWHETRDYVPNVPQCTSD